MIDMTDANPLFSEPLGLIWFIAIWLLARMARSRPAPIAGRATIALGPPRLVPLDPDEEVAASRLLASIAADAMAESEGWG